jgi:hypothetical protein
VVVVVGGALLVRAVVGGDDGDPFVEPDFSTTSTTVLVTTTTTVVSTTSSTATTVPAVECIDVANPSLLVTIAADAASAVPTATTGWFVAKTNGATWYTTADPTQDAEGELVPMNDQARVDSSSRRDVPPGDPLYDGHTDAEPEAGAARTCASTTAAA